MILVIDRGWVWWRWAVVAAGYICLVLLMRLAAKRIEERQLKEDIERSRSTSRFISTVR